MRTLLLGIFFDVSRHRIDKHINWLKLLVSVNEASCMELIDRAEQIGLTWPGTTSRAKSMIVTTQNTTEPQLLRNY